MKNRYSMLIGIIALLLIAPVAGVPKFTGQVGTIGSRLAFQIASVLE